MGQFVNSLSFYVHGGVDEALVTNAANASLPVCAWKGRVTAIYGLSNSTYSVFTPPGNQFSSLTKLVVGRVYLVLIPAANLPFSTGVSGQVELMVSAPVSPQLVNLLGPTTPNGWTITAQNGWTINAARYVQIAPKVYDFFFNASKSRSQAINHLEAIALLPFTADAAFYGTPFDHAMAEISGDKIILHGIDSVLTGNGQMPPENTSPPFLYGSRDAQYAVFAGRIYLV